MRALNRVRDVLRLYMKTIDVIQPAIPRLGHQRQTPRKTLWVGSTVREPPGNNRVTRDADTVGVSQDNRPLQEPALLYPGGAGHFAVAI